MKVHHLLNSTSCDKLSTAIDTVRSHSDKNKKVFIVVVAYFLQYIDKHRPIMSLITAFIMQTRLDKRQKTSPANGIFKEKIKLKNSRKEHGSMLTMKWLQLYEFMHEAGL